VLVGLFTIYPVRLVIWAYTRRKPSRTIPISIPSTFDPAPILYPQLIPIFVSLLVAVNVKGVILPNLVLSLCTLPGALIPTARYTGPSNPVHWLISCIPLFLSNYTLTGPDGRHLRLGGLPIETLALLYPLHQTLCAILQHLTTTSLLPAELQLLSVSLINILLLSYSPQAEILKALLWVGGLSTLILCGPVIRWGISLARVPKWRFNRAPAPSKGFSISRSMRSILLLARRPKHDFLASDSEESSDESGNSSDEDYGLSLSRAASLRVRTAGSIIGANLAPARSSLDASEVRFDMPGDDGIFHPSPRRHTLPSLRPERSKTHTPSGRRKRSASTSVQSFFNLTHAQATARKWLYACYVYLTIMGIILGGVRLYVQRYALSGAEPIGWALGYLFGDLPRFRFQVVNANLERWILLPSRPSDSDQLCHLGRIAHLRHTLGEANTRLLLSSYFLLVIATGLAIVLRLSPVYEVDTRRKVFHFMMVAMFLPATFVDPTFCALGLSVVLAVFLLVDLVRASQLPPFSKPIARFLTPYVDGRDLRGPVVVSHIFLLIGCAIPLWLSLAAVPRTGEGAMKGWEVPTRDISMVSGVVCVGLGDAAASLIGRRWGRRKWLWGGGKSLEGSLAFALAVFAGLMAANAWLRVGGWPVSGNGMVDGSWWPALRKTGLCASVASLTEAVLTGGNDNVVVPVVLWTCVKSTGI
jgi:dolichol kinase